MLRTQQLKIITLILVVLPIYGQKAQADNLEIFVNDTLVKAGTTIKVLPNSIVRYEIRRSPPGPIELDLTGDGTLKQALYGSNATFSTIYNDGTYKPQIKSDSKIQSFKLLVSSSLQVWTSEFTKIVPQIMWPIVALFVFLILCIWGKLHNLVKSFRIGTIEVSGIKMTSADLEVSLRQAIEKTIQNLEKEFPPEMSPEYMKFSMDPEVGHYVHVVEFLRDIGFKIQSGKAWNAVGNYYFYQNIDKAQKAYQESISLDPEDPTPYINLGMCFHLVRHDLHTAQKWFKTGIDLSFKKGISVPWAHVGLASVYSELRKKQKDPAEINRTEGQQKSHIDRAKKDFERATQSNGTDFWSYFGLGWCLDKQDNPRMAITYTSTALELKDDFVVARYNLATQRARSGECEKSVDELYKLLEPIKSRLKTFGIDQDPDLKNLKGMPRFEEFLKVLDLEPSVTEQR